MKYYLYIEDYNGKHELEFDSLKEARSELSTRLSLEYSNGSSMTKQSTDDYTVHNYWKGNTHIYIKKEDKTPNGYKIKSGRDYKQASKPQLSTTKSLISMSISTKIPAAVKKLGKTATQLVGTHTNGIGQKVAYMQIPVAFATLPKDSTVIQRKRLDVVDVKGGAGFEIYVLACSKKRPYRKFDGSEGFVQNWYVARKRYFGGKPAFDEMLYQGTNHRDAAHRFADIPYNELYVKLPEGVKADTQVVNQSYTSSTGQVYNSRWAVYKSDGKYATIAANRSMRYQSGASRYRTRSAKK